jgi:ribulose-5-phosphate 4-epimerase/fuculose-1-phosphate aldolase
LQDDAGVGGRCAIQATFVKLQVQVSDVEWQARCGLAGLYRICDFYGWTAIVNTHMSVRVPGEPASFLIKQQRDLFSEVTASSLVKAGVRGKIPELGGAVNTAGFTIHASVYKARPDVNCVMHTHTAAGTGISVLEKGIRPISQDALEVYDEIAYHEYGQPSEEAEALALGESCQHGNAIVLRSHGLLTVGSTMASAFFRMYQLNRACEIEIIARGLDEKPTLIDAEVLAQYATWMQRRRAMSTFGMEEFLGAMRQVEGRGTDWRT